jgi:hypothetical protein
MKKATWRMTVKVDDVTKVAYHMTEMAADIAAMAEEMFKTA